MLSGGSDSPAPTTVDAFEKRYTLHTRGAWFHVREDYLDPDFGPDGMWVQGPIIGKFRTREDAATFMRGYLQEKSA